MASIRFTLNREGVRALARSPQLQAEILERAERVAERARGMVEGDERLHIHASAVVGRNRIHGSVMYDGGLRAELKNRILGQCIDAAGPGVQYRPLREK